MLKFSTTPLVSGEIHIFIRWSAYTLGVLVKREGSLTRTPPPPPPPPSISARRVAGCRNEPSRWLAYAYSFCLSGSLPDCVLLNRLKLVRRGRPTFVRL